MNTYKSPDGSVGRIRVKVLTIEKPRVTEKRQNIRFQVYQIPGVSDIIAIKRGCVIFVEVKTPRGRQSDNQKIFEKNIDLNGGIYFVARSLDELIEKLPKLA